jgi:hypothetical protein
VPGFAQSRRSSDKLSRTRPAVPKTKAMKWSIRDLWGRLTQKKEMKPEVRNMLTSLDGVYEHRPAASAPASPSQPEGTTNEPERR